MDKKVLILNIVITICDFLVCVFALIVVGWAAFFFGKWWIALFGIVPLALYSSHGVIVESDLKGGEEDQQKL